MILNNNVLVSAPLPGSHCLSLFCSDLQFRLPDQRTWVSFFFSTCLHNQTYACAAFWCYIVLTVSVIHKLKGFCVICEMKWGFPSTTPENVFVYLENKELWEMDVKWRVKCWEEIGV